MKEWTSFFVAIVGAASTLTGLIFVGVSISLNRILSVPQLPDRAKGALVILMNILFVSLLCIIPQQSSRLMGIELLISCITTWVITLILDIHMLKVAKAKVKTNYQINIAFTQLALLPSIFAGFITIEIGFAGIYWLIPGILFSFAKAVSDAWVLLIEVNR